MADLRSKLITNENLQSPYALRAILRTVFNQPGGIDAAVAELSEGDYSVIDTMRALNQIEARA